MRHTLLAAAALLVVAVTSGCSGAGPMAVARVASAAAPTSAPVAVEATAAPAPAAGRVPVVVLDPGHAVDESGAAAYGVVEKDSNLEMAFRVARMLHVRGVEVVMTRTWDVRANAPDGVPQPQGFSGTRLDLQARIDMANAAKADAFVSLHSNGIGDPSVRGYEVYYNSRRPFSEENRRLATLISDGIGTELRAAGLPAMPRGVIDDACLKMFQGQCFPLFVLGPPRVTTRDEVYRRGGSPEALGFAPGQDSISSRATEMPGALTELLFISSPDDAALLRDDSARETLARGVARGILEFIGMGGSA